ncbi:LmbE family protein [Hyaloraphidium curvatum]|nr:LmbE family protein [Hyaloraphidium curvatum]
MASTDDPVLRIMVIGAHPDDCEYFSAGTASIYTSLGHRVRFVSLTNGDAGHPSLSGKPLAERRKAEAEASARVLGVERVTVLDNHDGELVDTLDLRRTVIALIREFAPDAVFTHRPWDYHPDHRATGRVVGDAMQQLAIRAIVPDVPPLARQPVLIYMFDMFRKPYPFQPEVVVDVTPALQKKVDALEKHTSQVFEFLYGEPDVPPAGRRAWLERKLQPELMAPLRAHPEAVSKAFGDRAGEVKCVEVFEAGEYGARLTEQRRRRLFPFLYGGSKL